MDTIAKLYPSLNSRTQIPTLYIPCTLALTLLPFFSPNRRQTALLILPILLSACFLAPCYTFGNPSADFYRSSTFIITPLWFIEFAILRPQSGIDAPMYVGCTKQGGRRGIEDCESVWEKLRWAGELMVPSHRGIGWNWEIKNVPVDPDANLSRWKWILNNFKRAVLSYAGSMCMLVLLGFASAMEDTRSDRWRAFLVDAVIGWAGAIWIYLRLCSFYNSSSVIAVALGIYETWQLPPLMGSIRDAWSVRQFWAVYHQTMREMVSQPARRITRAFGLRKGSLASVLSQLFLAFGVSCIVHQYQMFNVTRRDMGEFPFFMSQPVAITFEGFMMQLWLRYVRPYYNVSRFETLLGYSWVFIWFSYSLPIYLKGSRDAGIIRDAFFGAAPFDFGTSLADAKLRR